MRDSAKPTVASCSGIAQPSLRCRICLRQATIPTSAPLRWFRNDLVTAFYTFDIHRNIERLKATLSQHSTIQREESHEYDPGKLPSGSAHGSGRLGAGTCRWSKGTGFETHDRRQSAVERNTWPYATTHKSARAGWWLATSPASQARTEPVRRRMKPAATPSPPTPAPPALPSSTVGYSLWQSQEATANQIEDYEA